MAVRTLPRVTTRSAHALRHADAITVDRPSILTDDLLVATARALAYGLPLGNAPEPLAGRDRRGWVAARRYVEASLVGAACKGNACVDVDESAEDLARRLARARVVAPAAADALTALLPVLRRGGDGVAPPALEGAAVKVAERVAGYLRSVRR